MLCEKLLLKEGGTPDILNLVVIFLKCVASGDRRIWPDGANAGNAQCDMLQEAPPQEIS